MASGILPSFVLQDLPRNLQYLTYIGTLHLVHTEGKPVEETIDFLIKYRNDTDIQIDCQFVPSAEDCIRILDNGAVKIYVNESLYTSLKNDHGIDPERLVLDVSGPRSAGIVASAVILKTDNKTSLAEDLKRYGSDKSQIYIYASSQSLYEEYKNSPHTIIVPANLLTEDLNAHQGISIADALLANARSDRPDGLYTTVVTDERGVALGLVYSSLESVRESIKKGAGVYQSRERGLWHKGATSGDIQVLKKIELDCDSDCLKFTVQQKGRGFCHLATPTCFGQYDGLSKLEKTLKARKESAPEGSYTARLFSSPGLLRAKIMEEAEELCDAKTASEVAFEAADLIYFALTKAIAAGVDLKAIEKNLDLKALKVQRRKGDAKGKWAQKEGLGTQKPVVTAPEGALLVDDAPKATPEIKMKRFNTRTSSRLDIEEALRRPSQRSTDAIMGIVKPIVKAVQEGGDKALLEYTHKFEKATSLKSPVLKAPFPAELMKITPEVKKAIDISFDNILKFHSAQKESKPLQVETMPGVVCSRFVRPIQRVGLYVPGGTAVLPSTALMLGVPALVAGCEKIVLASPPRADGSITPEIVYVAQKVGAESIVLAGGAQAVAALAYGTESVTKVDKILGPGNQFVTAAKMLVSNDTSAGVAIDMPAGPSEVLVIADKTANPAFVASDLLSQAEHGVDSQVILIAVSLSEDQLKAIEKELEEQALALPRVEIVKGAIDHSFTLQVDSIEEAMELSNFYAPEHLILQVENAPAVVDLVQNAGSVFIGEWTPESVGDYSAGVNHSLRKSYCIPCINLNSRLIPNSNVRLRSSIFWRQSRLLCQAYHFIKFDSGRIGQCW
jgi:phosphoribosyl-ATP pyrophosphohydrolase/phosphoribosyl-AMP cyclohydrolase/histidinol dehydrogenase